MLRRVSPGQLFWHGGLPFALGGLQTLAFAPHYRWPLTLLVYAALFGLYRARRQSIASAFCTGFAFGTGLFLIGGGWFIECVREYYASSWLHAGALMTVFIIVMAGAHVGLPLAIATGFERTRPACRFYAPLAFCGLVTLSDWLRSFLFTGFSWLEIGYTHSWPSPLARLLPYGGVHLVTLISLIFSVLLAGLALALYRARSAGRPAIFAWLLSLGLLAALLALIPPHTLPEREQALSAKLVQGNASRKVLDHRVFIAESAATYLAPLDDRSVDLIVAPESAFPDDLARIPGQVMEKIRETTARNGNTFLFGTYVFSASEVWNAALAVRGDQVQPYRKRHLIPFAEYTPAWFSHFVPAKRRQWGEFTPGDDHQEPLVIGQDAAAVSICYEALFGEEFAYAAPKASFLVSLNNLVWLGTREALHQHLQLSQVRAAEYGKPLLQVSNTGITAHIDPSGRILASTGVSEAAELRVSFKGTLGSTWYARLGNAPMVACLLTILFILYAAKPTRSPSRKLASQPAP